MTSSGDSAHRSAPQAADAEAAAWEASGATVLAGSPPSLAFAQPASQPSSASAALSVAEAKALAATAAIPPPQRKVLEGLVLLWHGHWDAAHAVAQSHEGQSDHDFLHAIGHRREGDYPNADYWFGSAGKHPVVAALSRSALAVLPEGHPLRPLLLPGGRWSTRAFTAEVRRAVSGGSPKSGTPDTAQVLQALQALEMRLFAGCLLAG
jgi:hypothetical protein